MRELEPKAYIPNIVSIGPYHNGSEHVKEMKEVKWKFVHRLFDPRRGVGVDDLIDVLEGVEREARKHYADEVMLTSDEFVKMMLVDGCFVVELLRELEKYNFSHGSPLIGRWMLPVLRRDLIMLENQLPLFVLQTLFELTSNKVNKSAKSLQELAVRFFTPLIQKDSSTLRNGCCTCVKENSFRTKRKHLLDLFRFCILPKTATEAETTASIGKCENSEGNNMIRSIRELKEANMKFEKKKDFLPLDVRSEGRVLVIPPLHIDDYRGTLFRNMVAFEQCHHACKPQVTAYLFFLDGLVNCDRDVEFMVQEEMIQHSLGSNAHVADLVNSICQEVGRDIKDSYLQKVLWDADAYMNSGFAMVTRLLRRFLRIPTVRTVTASLIKALLHGKR